MEKMYNGNVQKWAKSKYRYEDVLIPLIFVSGFFDAILSKKEDHVMKTTLALKDRIATGYWSLVAMVASLLISLQPTLAADNTIWTKISEAVQSVYTQILGISTIIAVTAAAIALLVRMISRNQRAVDEATTWLKRILITWLILNTLGFIIAYLQGFINGGRYTI